VAQPRPLFVTLEGIEGSGKSTQIRRLAAWLADAGHQVEVTREPGRTELGEAVRGILLDPRYKNMTPLTDLLLYNAARAQHLAEVIEPALAAGRLVLCDRYKDSTLAYQGFAGDLPLDAIADLHRLPGLARDPDLTLLLDLPVAVGLARARQRLAATGDRLGRFERLDDAFHQKVRDGYLELARQVPGRFVVIDAQGDEATIFGRLRDALATALARRS
jgi:dTMP kinase